MTRLLRKTLPLLLAVVSACVSTPAAREDKAADALQVRMVRFEGGRLRPAGRDPEVEVAPFLMDATEVTAAAYAACVKAGVCNEASGGPTCTFGESGMERYPINCVTWDQATTYCSWLGKRLPSEVEWEWAARGGPAARRFPWGDEEPTNQLCWNGLGSPAGKGHRRGPCPVGSFPRGDTPEGLKDMAGNVQEWTSTVWKGAGRICRGGSWFYEDDVDFMTTRRNYNSATFRDNAVGFRCAKSP
jgi:formylglycine-generating enzyme